MPLSQRSRIIINADDFGLSAGVNAGIRSAHRDGILTSATLLANAPAFDQAVHISREEPRLGVGVHLNIVRGAPLSPPGEIMLLVDGHGVFRRFRFRHCTGAFLAQAEREYRRQIEKVLKAGIRPDHVDFEKHHAWQAPLYELAARLAEEYGIRAIRSLREPVVWAIRHMGWPGARNAAMAALLRTGVQMLGGATALARPDWFLGQTHIGRMDEKAWTHLLDNPPAGVIEVMTHPGLPDAEKDGAMGASWLETARSVELAALVSPDIRKKFADSGATMCRFSDIF